MCLYECVYDGDMPKFPKVIRNVRVEPRVWDAAKRAADLNDESVSDVIRRALNEYVEKNQ